MWQRVKVNKKGCWLWQGSLTKKGYGSITVNYKSFQVHRLAYALFNGALHQDREVDHECRNPACCNPKHLRQVTTLQNQQNSTKTFTAINAKKKRCPHGHPLDGVTRATKKVRSHRYCKTCSRLRRMRNYNKRKRGG